MKEQTRDGDKEILLITNLPKKAADATKIAELYRGRWTIETVFQHLADHLNSEINTLGYPRAALFGFCVALVSYIIVSVIKAALGSVHGIDIIENYPKGSCALFLQKDRNGLPIHVVWGIPRGHDNPAVLITAYRPDPERWDHTFKRRR